MSNTFRYRSRKWESKKRSPESVIEILHRVDALVAQGMTAANAAEAAHITEMTYYRWRKRYEGMSAYQIAWLMRLLESNARLRRTTATLKADKRILVEVSRQLLSTSGTRRVWVDHVKQTLGVSERRACQVLGQHRSTQRKIPKILGRSRYSQPLSLSNP
ncbi:MAG: helix-turn-helix domain-containing protein [Alphaproteobacteria bacterium]